MLLKRPNPGSTVRFLPTALLFCTWAFCLGQENTLLVQDIRFGIIEPPVVAQANITVRAPTSNQQTDPKPLECSGLAWLNGSLLIASDRHEHLLFTCTVDLKEMVIGTPEPWVLLPNEQNLLNDAESLTVSEINGRAFLYMMCSLSNAPDTQPLPQRRHLLCGRVKQLTPFRIDRPEVLSMTPLRRQLEDCFLPIHVRPYYTYDASYPGQDKNTYRWGNVEGIAFTPDGRHLLCGMRNPLFDQAAMVFAVTGLKPSSAPLEQDALNVTDLFLLDLQGRGISDLCWDPVTAGYLITAAKSNGPRLDPDLPFPPNSLDSALFWWSGSKSDTPVLVARMPDMSIEAVCRLERSRYIAIGSDEGDVSEGRTTRQSILTILEFTGVY